MKIISKYLIGRKNWKVSVYIYMSFSLFFQTACKKLVEIEPPVTSVNGENVFKNDASAISVLTGAYANVSTGVGAGFSGLQGLSLLGGLSSDELMLYSGSTDNTYLSYYQNKLMANPSQNIGSELWVPLYNLIFTCNSAIAGINGNTTLTPKVKQQLLGEAKFLRGYIYFHLVNLFGDVPLALSTDYTTTSNLVRSTASSVNAQIIADLKDAESLLSDVFLDGKLVAYTGGNTQRLRPTKWAASALLARVYLYNKDWANSEIEASNVISNSSLFTLESINNVFLANNKEAIWQLQPVRDGYNTLDGYIFILPSSGPNDNNPVYLNPKLLLSFESGDKRRANWVDSLILGGVTYYYPYKYKVNMLNSPVTEYQNMIRLSELYLVRAEARAQLNRISDAQNDLNLVRNRAGLGITLAGDKDALVTAILHERQVELFTELAQRWFDLKRTNTIDSVMKITCPLKGGQWQSYQQLYPILYSDLQRDHNLTQNSGY